MEPESRYAWIGAAVLVLAGLLGVGLYWLTGGLDRQVVKRYVVYFQNQSLEGLQINSDVRMQGIKVGKVEDYAIMPGETRKVRAVLQVDARTPVLDGVAAVVERHLVTGLATISLEYERPGGAPLMRPGDGEEYPVIPEGVPQLARVASTLEDLGQVGREALVRFSTTLSDQNQQAIAGSLANINALTAELRRTVPELGATLATAREAMQRVNGVLSEQNQQAIAGTLSNVSVLSDELRQSVPQLNASLVSARQAAERLDGTAVEANRAIRATTGHIDRLAADTETTLAAARQTLSSARDTLTNIDRNMRDLTRQVKLTADLGGQEIQATAQSLRQAGAALEKSGRALSDPARVLYGPNPQELGPGEKRR